MEQDVSMHGFSLEIIIGWIYYDGVQFETNYCRSRYVNNAYFTIGGILQKILFSSKFLSLFPYTHIRILSSRYTLRGIPMWTRDFSLPHTREMPQLDFKLFIYFEKNIYSKIWEFLM